MAPSIERPIILHQTAVVSGDLQVYERTKELKVKGGHAGLAGSVNKRRIASITQIYRCIFPALTPNLKYLRPTLLQQRYPPSLEGGGSILDAYRPSHKFVKQSPNV